MVELELRGLLGDGEHLTLAGPDGQHYRLRVDDALRAAVRRDRPQLEQLRAAGGSSLRPKEIQAKIRAGATAEEVAEEAGLPVEHVRRYEGPVIAERTWVVEQARNFHIGRAEDAPVLGDLVVDRLAARGVRTSELQWDAVRGAGKTWEVLVTFEAGERRREARWQADMTSRAVHALDDESRWLSETDVSGGNGAGAARRHLSPVRVYDVESDGDLGPVLAAVDAHVSDMHNPSAHSAAESQGDAASTDDLLAELTASRGTRQELDLGPGFDDVLEGGDWDGPPAAHPPASRAHEAHDAHVLALPERARPDGDADRGPADPGHRPTGSGEQRGGGVDERTSSGQQRAGGGEQRPTGNTQQRPTGDGDQRVDSGHQQRGAGERRPTGNGEQRVGGGEGGARAADGARPTARRSVPATGGEDAKRRARPKGRRTSVPSWDEIVFGAKPE